MEELDANKKHSFKQLCLILEPANPYAAEYFVPHSGTLHAQQLLSHLFQEVCDIPKTFRCLYIYGASGAGKTHLIHYFFQSEVPFAERVLVKVLDLPELIPEDLVGEIIAVYDQVKRDGGLLIFVSRSSLHAVSQNPHVSSRFLAGSQVCLSRPREDELEPVLRSLMERRNLSLSQPALRFLLSRLPVDILSFGEVLDQVAELCFTEQKPAKRAVIKEILENSGKKCQKAMKC